MDAALVAITHLSLWVCSPVHWNLLRVVFMSGKRVKIPKSGGTKPSARCGTETGLKEVKVGV